MVRETFVMGRAIITRYIYHQASDLCSYFKQWYRFNSLDHMRHVHLANYDRGELLQLRLLRNKEKCLRIQTKSK